MTRALQGKAALVTGGARGIGRAIAERLLAEGASVAITAAHDMAGAEAAAREPAAQGQIVAVPMDLTDRVSINAGVAAAVAALGGLDLAVNKAGTSARGRLLDLSTGDWDRLFAVHTRGFFYLATAAARAMPKVGAIVAPSPGPRRCAAIRVRAPIGRRRRRWCRRCGRWRWNGRRRAFG